jgi:hypothetical protein
MNTMPVHTTAAPRQQKSATILAYASLCLFWLGTVILSFMASDRLTLTKYKLTSSQLHMLQLIFAVPGLLIWLTVLFAGLSIWRYARTITGAKESHGFRLLAYSIFVLLVGLIISSYLGGFQQLASQNAEHPQQVKTMFVIFTNYVSAIVALATYGLLLRGSQSLLASIGQKLELAKRWVYLALVFVPLTLLYLVLIHGNPARQMTVDPAISPTFGLPYWWIVLTVALPFVSSWVIGAVALVGLYQYRANTTGIVYKLLFKKLLTGMTLLIGLTILLQLVSQQYTLYADRSLSFILGLVALIYLILMYAFVLIAQGSLKLHKVETLLIE